MNKIYIGIDCGLDGGIVTIDERGQIIDKRIMPTVEAGKGRKIDLHELDRIFMNCGFLNSDNERPTIIIENPGHHAPSASGLRSMTYSFAVTEMACVANSLRYHDLLSQKWQKEFWSKPKMPKGKKFDTKAAALMAARKLWPQEEWRMPSAKTGKLLKNPHDGIVDAALLAEYARRKF